MTSSVVRAPDRWPSASLPSEVVVYEVGPRDGLQNESTPLPVEAKAEFIERLVAAGVRAIELTSFVRADRVPQLADAASLLRRLALPDDVRAVVLTPNLRAVQEALHSGAREIAVFASATEEFSQRNLNCSIEESIARFEPAAALARDNGLAVRGYVSMCFGDPWQGRVPPEAVATVAGRLLDIGVTEISIGDTIGTATPGHVAAVLAALTKGGVGLEQIAVHFHDTYGQALSNAAAAMQLGVRVVDASAGGLGGCPFAGSATGNLATEDLVWQLHGAGVRSGIDLAALVDASRWLAGLLGRPSPSRVVAAMSGGS
jgi:hydroxymethylglutaryl-CoA lyase